MPGIVGTAMYFSGDDVVELPLDLNPDKHTAVTITAFIRLDSLPNNEATLAAMTNTGVIFYGGIVSLTVQDQRKVDSTATSRGVWIQELPREEWLFVALSIFAETRVIDGAAKPFRTTSLAVDDRVGEESSPGHLVGGPRTLLIGSLDRHATGYKFRGAIDEVRVYDRVLSKTELAALKQVTAVAPATRLSAAELSTTDYNEIARDNPLLDFDSTPDLDASAAELPGDNVADLKESLAGPDWSVIEVSGVKPEETIPGGKVEILVRLAKSFDESNSMSNVRVRANFSGNTDFVDVTLDATDVRPNIATDVRVPMTVPSDFDLDGAAARTQAFFVEILAADGSELQDRDPKNNGKWTEVTVHDPVAELCGELRFLDTRTGRSDDHGSRLTTAYRNKMVPIGGLTVENWVRVGRCIDLDPNCGESDDQRIGSIQADRDSGAYCLASPRAAPVYLRIPFETNIARIMDQNDRLVAAWSDARMFPVAESQRTLDWSISCENGSSNCDVQNGVTGRGQQNEDWGNTLATINHIDAFYSGPVSPKIDFYVTGRASSDCSTIAGGNNQAREARMVCVATPRSNFRVAHEVGHILMNRALRLGTRFASSCGGATAFGDIAGGNEKCSTTEGFANFFGAAMFFAPSATNPFYTTSGRTLEADIAIGNAGPRQCVSIDASPHQTEGNVTRFFWDLYDSNSDSAILEDLYDFSNFPGQLRGTARDDDQHSVEELVDVWRRFEPGFGPGQAEEAATSSSPGRNNGRNAKDFVCHLPSAYSELLLNCLGMQEAADHCGVQ